MKNSLPVETIYLCFKKENSKQIIDELRISNKKDYFKEYILVTGEKGILNGNIHQGTQSKPLYFFIKLANYENDINLPKLNSKNLTEIIKEKDNLISKLEENNKILLENQTAVFCEIQNLTKYYENALLLKNGAIEALEKQIEKHNIFSGQYHWIICFGTILIIIIIWIGYICVFYQKSYGNKKSLDYDKKSNTINEIDKLNEMEEE